MSRRGPRPPRSHYIPRAGFCPKCGQLSDGATSIVIDKPPVPGDIGVCLYCAAVLQYGPTLTLQTFDDWREACADCPSTVARIARAVRIILLDKVLN